MKARSKSSGRWLNRQRRDPYVRRAAEQGLVSRAHFKLEQLDRRFKLVARGAVVLELGAAPGGWTRYLAERAGRIYAVDVTEMTVPRGVEFARIDVMADAADAALAAWLGERRVDLVLSDMSPHLSGIRAADQARSMALVERATALAERWLNPRGALVVKMFQGEGVAEWQKAARRRFQRVVLAKPDASRKDSREMYAVAMDFSGPASAVAGPGDV